MKLFIATHKGEDAIACDPTSTTVAQLHHIIEKLYCIPSKECFLQFGTKILSLKDRILSEYTIQHGDRIHMHLRLSGGIDYQNRVGSKPGSGGVASESQANIDRRERLRKLALETIDLSKDPYFMKNHLGSYECKLCLTLHNNEGNYLAHTQGKRHQTNLARRAAKEASEAASSIAQANFLEATAAAAAAAARPRPLRIGLPGYKVMKQRDPNTNARMLTFQILYPEYDRKLQPRHRFMSAYEQKMEPADKNFQYLLFACEPYETIGFKIPNLELDRRKEKFFSNWDKEAKTFTLQLSFAAESEEENNMQPPAPPPPRPQLRFL
uniref:Splicing factor 3A subunit putative n=1 Tax=Albugo laibachii Nc14 TaxID=890382 RepID=F0WD56_9STRA|nr:splicing factor 3A subunit putative [Albugo laibachii Nc14]|eukprot:CCA19128.1 splicing factor 3A subunit putative [Albugo laibachii Nc14]